MEALEVLLRPLSERIAWLKSKGVDDPFLWSLIEEGDHEDQGYIESEVTRYTALLGLGRRAEIDEIVAEKHAQRARNLHRQAILEIEWEMDTADFLMERGEIRTLRPPLGVPISPERAPTTVDGTAPCPNCGKIADYQHNIFAESLGHYDPRYLECWDCSRVYILDENDNLVTPEGQAEYERDMAQWEAEYKSRRAARLAARAERDAQMQFIEEQLAQMGLRMMRAYEHLAEDEDWYRLAESGDFPRMLYA